MSLVTYGRSDAVVQFSFDDYSTEDGVFAGIDLVPFVPSDNAELYWGLRALNTSVFRRHSNPSRADARLVCRLPCSVQLSLLPMPGWAVSSSLQATRWGPSVADRDGGMSASCRPWIQLIAYAGNGWPHSALRYHQLMPISCHFRDCQSASGHESELCKKRYSKYRTCTFYIFCAAGVGKQVRSTAAESCENGSSAIS